MEIYELRYFLGAARTENLQRAGELLHVSPASISKAIARLEKELSVPLFRRQGRNIRITDHGRLLQKRASEIVGLEESVRVEVGLGKGALRAVIAGPEVLLSGPGVEQSRKLLKRYPGSFVELLHCPEEQALEAVEKGEAQLAFVTRDPGAGFSSKVVQEPSFQTFCGQGHPLFERARGGKAVPVEEVLLHAFAGPSHSFLGQVTGRQSLDGWRDDKFPRKISYVSSSLRLLEELALRGAALVYLPGEHGKRLGLERIRVNGCPYTCTQKVRLVARDSAVPGFSL